MKKTLKEYRIPFLGLKTGKHIWDYRLDKKFFDEFAYSEIDDAEIHVRVELERQATMMIVNTHLNGSVQMICDHCGDPMEQPITGDFQLIVKFGQETGDSLGDILILGPQEYELDLSQFLYEYAHLCIPARRAHSDLSECNHEVISELEKYKVENDPESHWMALKNMYHEHPKDSDTEDDEEIV